jgi:hypothetical protein
MVVAMFAPMKKKVKKKKNITNLRMFCIANICICVCLQSLSGDAIVFSYPSKCILYT